MRRPPRALAAGAALVLAALSAWLPTAVPAAAATPGEGAITVHIVQMTPTSPRTTAQARQLTVEFDLTNTTGINFTKLTVTGVRGNPISNQSVLDATIANPGPPDPAQAAVITTKHPVTVSLAPHASTTVDFVTTTGTDYQSAGVCLCQTRIYPLYFQVHYTPKGGSDVVLGTAQTYLPSFGEGLPRPVQVSWVWPILDRPHRGASATVFTDDTLAGSVAGGRLDHLLQTVEQVLASDPAMSMTLLVDPDLIDELAVMATGKYQVQQSGGKLTPGTGGDAANSWLARLRGALDKDPNLQLAFTPYADPNVRSLAANGLHWAQQADAASEQRIQTAIGGRSADTDISWPAGASLDGSTLSALIRTGVRAVVISDKSLPGSTHQAPTPDALAPLRTAAGTADAAVISSEIRSYATEVIATNGAGLSDLPKLVAEVAVRAVQQASRSHYVVIAPPRTVDPNPTAASSAILATSRTEWSRPSSLGQAMMRVTPVAQGGLRALPQHAPLPEQTITAAHYLADELPTAQSLLTPPLHTTTTGVTNPAALVSGIAAGLQRSESTEWDSDTAASASLAGSLEDTVHRYVNGVRLIHPTQGTYTLGSSSSPLPLTIENTLDVPVSVRVQVSAVGGLPGFSADDLGVQQVGARSRLAVRIPVHVDRAGRIKVQVELTTPLSQVLGEPLQLSVRSTALGSIGKVITFTAAAVLVAALLLRAGRQWRRYRHNQSAIQRGRVEAQG